MMLAKNSGTQELIILINKMDEKNINWSQDRFDSIRNKTASFLEKSCGYDVESHVFWIPVSGLTRDDIKNGITVSEGSWYKGPTFMEVLDGLQVHKGDPEGPVRISIRDKYEND